MCTGRWSLNDSVFVEWQSLLSFEMNEIQAKVGKLGVDSSPRMEFRLRRASREAKHKENILYVSIKLLFV